MMLAKLEFKKSGGVIESMVRPQSVDTPACVPTFCGITGVRPQSVDTPKSGGVMTTEKLISELKNYGYDIYLEGENLRYKFHSLVEPPKERIAVLLDLLKKNKPEVISYLRAKESPNKPLSLHDAGADIQKMSLSEFGNAGITLRIRSEVLNDHVYFVSNDAVLNRNPLDAVSYTAKELQEMLDMEPEEVRAAHSVKAIFHKARVIEHNRVTA